MAKNTYHVVEGGRDPMTYRGSKKEVVKKFGSLYKAGKKPALITPSGNILRNLKDVNKLSRTSMKSGKGSSGGSGG